MRIGHNIISRRYCHPKYPSAFNGQKNCHPEACFLGRRISSIDRDISRRSFGVKSTFQDNNPIILKIIFPFLLFLCFSLLNGCTTTKTSLRDGPPCFFVDETKIPDAVPRREKLSKYGNKSFYRVKGRYYQVMSSSYNYSERGIASWYGTRFHKKATSNGERYNMLAMTAAHKHLPLPTYVRVTNLQNGKKVIVRVNDRGPFRDNRLIDLSYVAAKKLGMAATGTAYVQVDAINFDQNFRRPVYFAGSRSRGNYNRTASHVFLQVGSFKNKHHAERLQKRLLSMVSSPVHVNRSKQLYKVKIGPIKDMATEAHISQKLRSIGLIPHS